ncbi:MAG: class I SAM-dependent methyltransferase [Planctomycetes bacterium]|nr:class I SAM-dependent methyltransferase [Planctomycetota bacterium]
MNHFYQDIPGWFDFEDFYRQMVEEAPSDRISMFVEVGVFKGKSFCFLAVEAVNSRKPIVLHAVDRWATYAPGEVRANADARALCRDPEGVYLEFLHNIDPLRSLIEIQVHRADSLSMAKWARSMLDLVFLDANHSTAAVAADIAAWLPTIQPGGVLAGHDWQQPSVRQAVMASEIGGAVRTMGSVWYWRQPA